jgi:hypothetical protein
VIECDVSRVPAEVLALAHKQLDELARALAMIEPSNPFWNSLRVSGMRVEIDGWKFKFRVDFGAISLTEAYPVMPF